MMSQLTPLEKLCHAVANRDLEEIKHALAAGANPNDYAGHVIEQLPMQEAAQRNFVAGLAALHEAGGRIDGPPSLQTSPLRIAKTPLMVAVNLGHMEAARWLLDHGADVMRLNKGFSKMTAMELALDRPTLDMASLILQERPKLRGETLNKIATKIIHAAHTPRMAQWLLDAGVGPDLMSSEDEPWLVQVQKFLFQLSNPLTTLLIEAGANVNVQNRQGRTALHETVMYQNIERFIHLLRAGADPDIADARGETPRTMLRTFAEKNSGRGVEMNELLKAWEGSQNAHQFIQKTAGMQDLKPL